MSAVVGSPEAATPNAVETTPSMPLAPRRHDEPRLHDEQGEPRRAGEAVQPLSDREWRQLGLARDAQRTGRTLDLIVAEMNDPFVPSEVPDNMDPFVRAATWARWTGSRSIRCRCWNACR